MVGDLKDARCMERSTRKAATLVAEQFSNQRGKSCSATWSCNTWTGLSLDCLLGDDKQRLKQICQQCRFTNELHTGLTFENGCSYLGKSACLTAAAIVEVSPTFAKTGRDLNHVWRCSVWCNSWGFPCTCITWSPLFCWIMALLLLLFFFIDACTHHPDCLLLLACGFCATHLVSPEDVSAHNRSDLANSCHLPSFSLVTILT